MCYSLLNIEGHRNSHTYVFAYQKNNEGKMNTKWE